MFDPGSREGNMFYPMLSINISVSPVIGITLDTPNDPSTLEPKNTVKIY